MTIASVTAHALAIPPTDAKIPWFWDAFNQVLVEVRTTDGLVGWGEAFGYGQPLAVAAMIDYTVGPLLLGHDEADIRGLTDTMLRRTHLLGRYGVTTFAISGVEIALWDLAGQRAGQPLYRLLGGAASREVPAYASLVRYADLEQMAEHAARAVAEGYEMIKLHQTDVAAVARGRQAMGDGVALTVDINCEWTPLEAGQMAEAMDEYDLLWLEEPVWPPEDFAGLAEVMASTGVPLASGENACTAHQFKLMLDAGAVAFAQPSVTKVGGIGEFLKVATLAESYNVALAPHSPYFGPGFLASLHLLAHTRQAQWIEKLYLELETSVFSAPLAFDGTVYTLPDAPGLGLDIDRHVLKEYRMRAEK
ncbi:MAG: mandelate racemase/muconate lactonizing enzyme family protein [Candidatus Lambdaproteobacteria bacterium]|nr:mandelate racemase/muconate lactonizing enzyme family protein [Candidatus Lambdaproteobacteria bacterium]